MSAQRPQVHQLQMSHQLLHEKACFAFWKQQCAGRRLESLGELHRWECKTKQVLNGNWNLEQTCLPRELCSHAGATRASWCGKRQSHGTWGMNENSTCRETMKTVKGTDEILVKSHHSQAFPAKNVKGEEEKRHCAALDCRCTTLG